MDNYSIGGCPFFFKLLFFNNRNAVSHHIKLIVMKKVLFAILLSFAFMPSFLFAQGCMDDGGSSDGVSVKGYIQPELNTEFTGSGVENTFQFNRARIGFVGNIPYDVSYYVFAELSPFKTGYPYLLDAFVTYSRLPFAKISIGQFKSPMSLEQNTSCHSLYTINRSEVVEELAGPQRDLGLMILGGADTFFMNYYIGIMNGTGILTGLDTDGNIVKPYDNNAGKDIVGRVVFHPFSFLNIGGSFRYGTTPSATGGSDPDKTIRYGGELELELGQLIVQGEYIYGENIGSFSTGGGCGDPLIWEVGNRKRSGYFAQVIYKTPWNIWPVYKFENYNNDLDVDLTSINIQTFGISYFLNDWSRIQVNYRYRMEEAREVANDQILIQFQAKF